MKDFFPLRKWLTRLGLCLACVVLMLGAGATTYAQEEDETIHVVRYGETLSEIAQSYRVSMDTVMQENAIRNPNSIYVGQSLSIPVEMTIEAEAPVLEVASAEPALSISTLVSATALNDVYTVRPGDTLAWIALRYGVDSDALRAVNNLAAGESIHMGQTLILPATEAELRVRPATQQYTIRAGDSLGLIAQMFDVPMRALMAINFITNPDLIQPGQELEIPAVVSTEKAPPIGMAQSGFYYHDVLPGETPSEVAALYNSTPQAIARYNNLPNAETLFAGLEVRIPFGPPVLDRRLPPAPRSGTEFVVSISRQRCWVLRGDRVLHEWKCSTGQGEWLTRTGIFFVKTKLEMAKSTAYRLDMPYWLGIYDVGSYENGIHGLPVDWESGEKLWNTLVGQPATFGCAMLLDEDAAVLFDLAYLGMPVHIVE